jgi:hypothetical protein
LILATGIIFGGLWILAELVGEWGPVAMLAGVLSVETITLIAVWWRFGRGVLPASSVARIPLYAASKIPLYFSFVSNPQKEWVRTARDENPDNVSCDYRSLHSR